MSKNAPDARPPDRQTARPAARRERCEWSNQAGFHPEWGGATDKICPNSIIAFVGGAACLYGYQFHQVVRNSVVEKSTGFALERMSER